MQTERSPSFGVEGERGSSYAVSCRTCFLHITKACNLRCRHCYFAAGTTLPNELSTEEIARLWPAMVTLRPGKVVFTGGEPLLRLDTLDLLRGLRDADADHVIKRCLNTNGSLVTPELAKQLVGLADEVRISVDALRDRHDSLRGDGSFDAAMRALDCLYNVGFEPIAVITVSRNGLCDLEELICQLIARNIRRIKLNALRTIGRGSTRKESRVDDDAVRATMLRAWRRCFPDQPSPTEPYTSAGPSNCGIGSFLNIVPNGDVYPCHMLMRREFLCGNVRHSSLLEICRPGGLLARLAKLDFERLPKRCECRAMGVENNACLGTSYRDSEVLRALDR